VTLAEAQTVLGEPHVRADLAKGVWELSWPKMAGGYMMFFPEDLTPPGADRAAWIPEPPRFVDDYSYRGRSLSAAQLEALAVLMREFRP
jgi:hypothetical protein